MDGFKVEVKEASKDFTAKERVMIKDVSNAIKIADMVGEDSLVIDLDYYALLHVHNEKSDNKDYDQLVLVDKSGERYVTGSDSFIDAFANIYGEMKGVDEEWQLECLSKPSKNRSGQSFLTCTIV